MIGEIGVVGVTAPRCIRKAQEIAPVFSRCGGAVNRIRRARPGLVVFVDSQAKIPAGHFLYGTHACMGPVAYPLRAPARQVGYGLARQRRVAYQAGAAPRFRGKP